MILAVSQRVPCILGLGGKLGLGREVKAWREAGAWREVKVWREAWRDAGDNPDSRLSSNLALVPWQRGGVQHVHKAVILTPLQLHTHTHTHTHTTANMLTPGYLQ